MAAEASRQASIRRETSPQGEASPLTSATPMAAEASRQASIRRETSPQGEASP